jgi:KaiC/GvpD/RAD55 family RecA-like ATPase
VSSFKKASKSQAKLRAAVFGPSGSGKTFTSLRIATGLGGSIAVIDSERGSASMYADRFTFDVCDLADRTIEGYRKTIKEAGQAGYAVLVIDSLSHAWQELLEEVDQVAKAKYRGNTWSAWSDGTPKQRSLVEAILGFPGHVLATMRSKTEWTTGEKNGKSQPVRVGLAPEQGKGIEYEFALLLELNPDHQASVLKDRTGKFQDKIIDRPGEDFGRELAAWLDEGEATQPRVETPPSPEKRPLDNNSGYGRGQYASPEQVEAYSRSIRGFVEAKNAQWLDEWTNEDGVADGIGELLRLPQMTGHLLKWGLRTGRLEPVDMTWDHETGKPVEKVSVEKAKKYVAILFAREPEALNEEAEGYFRQEAAREREAWAAKHEGDGTSGEVETGEPVTSGLTV